MNKNTLAKMIDHTNLKPFATRDDIHKLCDEAKEYGFASVCVNPAYVRFAKEQLCGTDVKVCSVVAFPLGQLTIEEKIAETKAVLNDGADEVDYVLNIAKVLEIDFEYIEKEMREMEKVVHAARCVHEKRRIVKCIFENCFLSDEQILILSNMAKRVGLDFIKTSTGFGTGGATEEHVKIMKEATGSEIRVKAAGGIRTWETAKKMIDAGADRIGTSNGIAIIEGFICDPAFV